ncbi:MAG: gliding motility-associated C-terminal domain-containing protein, partial [Bacteroidota bacterium]
ELTIFSGFSPNGDGVNDFFQIRGIERFPNNSVLVFNRWGNEVFRSRGYTNDQGWDGRWEGKDLPDGTYFYVIEDGEGNQYSGYVQIHR